MPLERYKAEPIRSENSWRVIGDRGHIAAFRVSEKEAEATAKVMNTAVDHAEARVLAVRGSYDAPGFDVCAVAELKK